MLKEPNPIDLEVGVRIRQQRKINNVSQSSLADGCNVTFQQIQKYEKGTNRVSMSRMVQIAQIIGVSIDVFTKGLDDTDCAVEALTARQIQASQVADGLSDSQFRLWMNLADALKDDKQHVFFSFVVGFSGALVSYV